MEVVITIIVRENKRAWFETTLKAKNNDDADKKIRNFKEGVLSGAKNPALITFSVVRE